MRKNVLEVYPQRDLDATREDFERTIFIMEGMLEWHDICKGGKFDPADVMQEWSNCNKEYFIDALKLAAECVKEKYLGISN